MILKRRLSTAVVHLLASAAAILGTSACDPPAVDPLNPDIRLAYCREQNTDPCVYTADEVKSLLSSPNGLATKSASSLTSDQRTQLTVSYDTTQSAADPWGISESQDGKTVTLTFRAKDNPDYTIEVRDFWYLMAQALNASARSGTHECPTIDGGKVLFSLDDALSPDANEDCIYNLSAAHALLVPLLDGSAPRSRMGDELAKDIDGLISYNGVTTSARLGPALTHSGGGRRLFLGALAVGFLVLAVYSAGSNAYLASELPDVSEPDFALVAYEAKPIVQQTAYLQDQCRGVSEENIAACEPPPPDGCAVGDASTGKPLSQLVPCDEEYLIGCTNGSGVYDFTPPCPLYEASSGCAISFGPGFYPVNGSVPSDNSTLAELRNDGIAQFGTGLVACKDTMGYPTQCPDGPSSAQSGAGAFVSPSGEQMPVGEPESKKQKLEDEDDALPLDDSLDLLDSVSNCSVVNGKPCRIEEVRIHTLNVGQGSCHVVQCKAVDSSSSPAKVTVENALIDCGSTQRRTRGQLVGMKAKKAARYMSSHAITASPASGVSVDPPRVYVTHPDADHFNNLGQVFLGVTPSLMPSEVIYGGRWDVYRSQTKFNDFYTAVSNPGIFRALPGPTGNFEGFTTTFLTCKDATLRVVTANNPPQDGATEANANSAVLVFHWPDGKFAAVFPGDAPGSSESAAAQANLSGIIAGDDVRVLAASHHGASTHNSSSEELLQAVAPTHAVYSALTRHWHPTENTVRKLEDLPSLAEAGGHGLFYSEEGREADEVVRGGMGYVWGGTERSHYTTMGSGNIVISRKRVVVDDQATLEVADVRTGDPPAFLGGLPMWSSASVDLSPICRMRRHELTCADRRRLSQNAEPTFLVPGEYYGIQSISSERLVRVRDCDVVDQHRQSFPPVGREYWQLKRSSGAEPSYSVVSFETGRCLTAQEDFKFPQLAPCTGSEDQLWVFREHDFNWQLKSLGALKCLSTGGKMADNDLLEMLSCEDDEGPQREQQMFHIAAGPRHPAREVGYALNHLQSLASADPWDPTVLTLHHSNSWGITSVMVRADASSPWFMMTARFRDVLDRNTATVLHDGSPFSHAFTEIDNPEAPPKEALFALSPIREDLTFNVLSAYGNNDGDGARTQYCLEGSTMVVPCDATHADQRFKTWFQPFTNTERWCPSYCDQAPDVYCALNECSGGSEPEPSDITLGCEEPRYAPPLGVPALKCEPGYTCYPEPGTGVVWVIKDDGNVNGPTCQKVCQNALPKNCAYHACDDGRPVDFTDNASFEGVAEGLGFKCKTGGCWPTAPGTGMYLVSKETDANGFRSCYFPDETQLSCSTDPGNANCFGERYASVCPCVVKPLDDACQWTCPPHNTTVATWKTQGTSCLERINYWRKRACEEHWVECPPAGLPPMVECTACNQCANSEAEYDKANGAHQSFTRCGEFSQGEGSGADCQDVIDAFVAERAPDENGVMRCEGHCGPIVSAGCQTFSWGTDKTSTFYTLNWHNCNAQKCESYCANNPGDCFTVESSPSLTCEDPDAGKEPGPMFNCP